MSEETLELKSEQPSTTPQPPKASKKKLEITDYFVEGGYIDCLDFSDWRVGYIQKVNPQGQYISINFDGWPERWDQILKKKNCGGQLAPFRKFSAGYTGQQRSAMRHHPHTLVTVENLNQYSEELTKINQQKYEGLNVYDVTQQIRGFHYIFMDNVMSQTPAPNVEVLLKSIEYMKIHIKQAANFIKLLPSLYEDVKFSSYLGNLTFPRISKYYQGLFTPDSFITEEKVAIAMSIKEILESIEKSISPDSRLNPFYAHNSRELVQNLNHIHPIQYENYSQNEKQIPKDDENMDSPIQSQIDQLKIMKSCVKRFVNYFGSVGGFENLEDLLNRAFQGEHIIPIPVIYYIFRLIRVFLPHLRSEIMDKIIKKILEVVKRRLSSDLSDRQLMKSDSQHISDIIQYLRNQNINRYINPEENFVEELELSIHLKALKYPSLQKRLNALKEIKTVVENISRTREVHPSLQGYQGLSMSKINSMNVDDSNNQLNLHPLYGLTLSNSTSSVNASSSSKLNADYFIQWFYANNVFEIIFGDSIHYQIVKRSSEIIFFLIDKKSFPLEKIDALWAACFHQDETTLRIIYELIENISERSSVQANDRIYSHIKKLDFQQHPELSLKLLKEFTINALHIADVEERQIYSEQSQEQLDAYLPKRLYGYTELLELCMDGTFLTSLQVTMVLDSIKSILSQLHGKQIKIELLKIAFKNIKAGESVYQSCQLIKILLLEYFGLNQFDRLRNYTENQRKHLQYANIQQLGAADNQKSIKSTQKTGNLQNLQSSSQEGEINDDDDDDNVISTTNIHQSSLETIPPNGIKEVLELLKEKSLTAVIVAEIERYYKSTAHTRDQITKGGCNEDTYNNTIFAGQFSDIDNFNARFEVLQGLIQMDVEYMRLQDEFIDRMWDVMNLNEFDSQNLLKWICMGGSGQLVINQNFNFTTKQHIFLNIFCNHNKLRYQDINIDQFNTFFILFQNLNQLNGKIRVQRPPKYSVIKTDLDGLSALWQIFQEVANKQVVERVCEILSELHLRVVSNQLNTNDFKQMAQGLTVRCMNYLQTGHRQQQKGLIERAVMLLMTFFNHFQGQSQGRRKKGSSTYYSSMMPYNGLMKLEIPVRNSLTSEIKKIPIYYYRTTIGEIKQKASDQFKIPVRNFRFKFPSKQAFIDSDDEDQTYKQLNESFPQHGLVLVPKDPSEIPDPNYHPQIHIAEQTAYYDLIFDVLSDKNLLADDGLNYVWDLLAKLPTCLPLKQSIYHMDTPWQTIFSGRSYHQLFYCLKIIDQFTEEDLMEEYDNASSGWRQQFIESKGFAALIEMFIHFEESIIKNSLSQQFLSLLLQNFVFYLEMGYLNFQNLILNFSIFSLLSFFRFLFLLCSHSVIIQDLEVENQSSSQICDILVTQVMSVMLRVCQYTLERVEKDLQNCTQIVGEWNAEKQQQNNNAYMYNNYEKKDIKYPQFYECEQQIIGSCFNILNHLLTSSPENCQFLLKFPQLENLLMVGLLKSDNPLLKRKLNLGILNIIVDFKSILSKVSTKNPLSVFLPLLTGSVLNEALYNKNLSIEVASFFELVEQVFNNVDRDTLQKENLYDQEKLFLTLLNQIVNEPPNEQTMRDKDEKTIGSLKLMKILLDFHPQLVKYVQEHSFHTHLINLLFEVCHQGIDRKGTTGAQLKNDQTRTAALDFLLVINEVSLIVRESTLNYLKRLHSRSDWRTNREIDWKIYPKYSEISETGYVGLQNLACICYMNSLMQQLYMIPTFRKSIVNVDDLEFEKVNLEDNLLYQIKCMFMGLNESEQQSYNPQGFCHAFKDWDGQPTNVYEQMDVDEYFNMLMDRIQNLVQNTESGNFVKKHFGGVLSNEIISKACPHNSEREEPFLAISLQVKNKKNVYQAMQSMILGEVLQGDNSYKCEKCDKKVPALKRTCIKKLPNHLIVVLKRFEFDFDKMQKFKVNDLFEFPNDLNIEEFSQQGLRQKQQEEAAAKSQAPVASATTTNVEQNTTNTSGDNTTPEYPPDYFQYKLSGIVVHMGHADSGHYYSFIQDREIKDEDTGQFKWYEFNDTDVRYFDPANIANETFGGEEKWKYYSMMSNNPTIMQSLKEKIKNAYLLFYDRVQVYDEDENGLRERVVVPAAEKQETHEPETKVVKKWEVQMQSFRNSILETNLQFHMRRFLFSQEYLNFVTSFLRCDDPSVCFEKINYPFALDKTISKPKEIIDLELCKFSLTFFLTCTLREKDKNDIFQIHPAIQSFLLKSVPASQWLLTVFSDPRLVEEFFFECQANDITQFVVQILESAMKALYPLEAQGPRDCLFELKDNYPTTILANFINVFISSIGNAKGIGKDSTEFFRIFIKFAQLGPECVNYLLSKRLLGRLLDFYFEISSLSQKTFRDYSDVPFLISETPLIGLPNQEKKKQLMYAWDKLQEQKIERRFFDQSNQMYFWQCLVFLLRHCKLEAEEIVNLHPMKLGDLNFQLGQDDVFILRNFFEDKVILQVFQDSNNQSIKRSTGEFLAYLSYRDMKISTLIIDMCIKVMQESHAFDFSPLFVILKRLFALEDDIQNERLDDGMQKILLIAEKNEKYTHQITSILQFVISMAQRNSKVYKWIVNNKESIKFAIKYLESGVRFTEKYIQDCNYNYEKYTVILHKIRVPKTQEKLNILHQNMKEVFFQLSQKDPLDPDEKFTDVPEFDSDDDLTFIPLKKGDLIDYFLSYSNQWVTASVDQVYEDILNFKFDNGNPMWENSDNEYLAPHLAMQEILVKAPPVEVKKNQFENPINDEYEVDDIENDQNALSSEELQSESNFINDP